MNNNQKKGTPLINQGNPNSHLVADDDSFFDEEQSMTFALRNQNFQLKSAVNKLQYQKNKIIISYENTIKELRVKLTNTEKLLFQKSDKQDKNSHLVDSLNDKCQYLIEQNQQLKRQLHNSAQGYRITPNFKQLKHFDNMSNLIEQLQKPEIMAEFEKTIDNNTQKKLQAMKQQITSLQSENIKLKEKIVQIQKDKGQMIQAITKQTEDHHNTVIQFKDKVIQELKRSQITLSLQIEDYKKTITQMNMSQYDSTNQQKMMKIASVQNREKEEKIVQLEQTINKLAMENSIIKGQNSKLENQIKVLQNERKTSENKLKAGQQQLYKLQNQFNIAKSSWNNEKLEFKKQMSSFKNEYEDQKNKCKFALQQKQKQIRKNNDFIARLTTETKQLKQREPIFIKNLDQLNKQNQSLKQNIQKLIKKLQKAEQTKSSSETQKYRAILQQKQNLIQSLKQEVNKLKQQTRKSNQNIQSQSDKLNLQQQLHHKEQVIQILKLDKNEQLALQRQLENKIKQTEAKFDQKQMKIASLQQEIKILKDDNHQLQTANDELKDKIETLKKIRQDVQNINYQLKKEKLIFLQKKKEQSKLRLQSQNSRQISNDVQFNSNAFHSKYDENQQMVPQKLLNMGSKESSQGKDIMINLIKQLKTQNFQLQARIGQVQNQRDRKGVDLNIKESELKNIKQQVYKPKDIIFQPLIDISKKNQFNAIFFQNKIMELQKEITQIRTKKQKEYQQFKKSCRKQMEQRIAIEFKKQKAYIHELQKKCNILTQGIQDQRKSNRALANRSEELQKQNYSIKVQFSQNLQQQKKILLKCKSLEQKYKENQNQSTKMSAFADEYHNLKSSYSNLAKNYQEVSLLLKNANEQIKKLNEILMIKESEIKAINRSKIDVSPNNSFIKSNRHEEKDNSFREVSSQHQKSSQGDVLKSWAQRRPVPYYSRI